jgi:transcriptional regulator with XRE-family HTH domain
MSPAEVREFLTALGACIEAIRLDLGVSRAELASRTGLSEPFVAALEQGRCAPNVLGLRRIAETLRVPLALLVEEATDPSPLVQVDPVRCGGDAR